MVKIKFVTFVTIFFGCLLASTVFASFNCPQEIDCAANSDASSCTPVGNDIAHKNYMLYSWRDGHPGTMPRAYFFSGATVDHIINSKDASYSIFCKYKLPEETNPDFYSFTVQNKMSASLQHYTEKNNEWREYTNKDGSSYARCNSDVAALCPLTERPGIIFYNTLITQYRNNEPLGVQFIRFTANFYLINITNHSSQGHTMFVPLERVEQRLSGCGARCIVNMSLGLQDGHGGWKYYNNIGTITVDMKNQLKILDVTSSSDLPNNIKMQKGPLNSIIFSTVKP